MKPRRRGFSLVECLIVIVVLGTILSTLALTMNSIFMTNRRVRAGLSHSQQVDRFIARFRTDSHQSIDATVDNLADDKQAANKLILTSRDGHTIEYDLLPDRIERTHKSGDATLHHDTFQLHPLLADGWQIDRDREFPLISVSLKPRSVPRQPELLTAHPMSIVAGLRPAPSATAAN